MSGPKTGNRRRDRDDDGRDCRQSQGVEPRSRAELDAKQGIAVQHNLEPLLLKDNHRVVHQALWLFTEYVTASTRGQMRVRVNIVDRPNLKAPVQVSWDKRGLCDLGGRGLGFHLVFLSGQDRNGTDWWWVLYPSAVPEQYPDFKSTEFVTGGMGSGPDGASPCFIIDDRWLTRRPPHLGHGPYTDIERRAYLPQWFEHEFFHHLLPDLSRVRLGEERARLVRPQHLARRFRGQA